MQSNAGRVPVLAGDPGQSHVQSQSQPVVLVLGMHRSGTSCLSGTLQQQGLHLGQVSERNPYNLRGNRENPRVAQLNEAVLVHSGGSWRQPPDHLAWTREHARERDAILADLLAQAPGPAGLKDPRALLTLAFWEQAPMPGPMLRVGIFRHPALVVRSLQHRNHMAPEAALALWQAYNHRLLAEHVRAPFPLLCFDASEDEYLGAVARVAAQLGLAPASPSQAPFFEADLRHDLDAMTDLEVPASVLELYQTLRKRSAEAA